MVKLRGVEQLLRFGQRGLIKPLHTLHNLRGAGRSIKGKVDVHVAAVSRLGCQANKLDLEILEAFETELFAKTVYARDRNVGARGKFLNRKSADVLTDGKGCNAELLLGGGEALRFGDLAFDIHANSHTRQTCQKGTGLFWQVLPAKGNGAEDAAGGDGLGEAEDVGDRMVERVDDVDRELMRTGGKCAGGKTVGRADACAE